MAWRMAPRDKRHCHLWDRFVPRVPPPVTTSNGFLHGRGCHSGVRYPFSGLNDRNVDSLSWDRL